MIKINRGLPSEHLKKLLEQKKNSVEWLSISATDSKKMRDLFDSDTKLKVCIRNELYIAQKGLCAYCMAKISLTPSKPDEKIKIEHYKPISYENNKDCKLGVFDYDNYFLVCSGGDDSSFRGNKNTLCCDSQKSNEIITIDPTKQEHIDGLGYNPDGTIYYNSSDSKEQTLIQTDIDKKLGLNGTFYKTSTYTRYDTRTRLVERRRQSFQNAQWIISELKSRGVFTRRKLEELIRKEENNPKEFSGVYIICYKNALNSCSEHTRNKELLGAGSL